MTVTTIAIVMIIMMMVIEYHERTGYWSDMPVPGR